MKSSKPVLSIQCDNLVQYYIPAADGTTITNAEIDVVKKMKWYSFEQYKKKAFSILCVTLPLDESNWLNGICNCQHFSKNSCVNQTIIQ